jgi:hypothetical protein
VQIDIPSTLVQAIEAVARVEGKSTTDWIVSKLEHLVALAAERRNFEEEQRKEMEVRNFEEMMKIHQSWMGL